MIRPGWHNRPGVHTEGAPAVAGVPRRKEGETLDIKKIIAKLPPGFAEDAAGMDREQLRAEVMRANISLRQVEQEMKADEKLTGARELVKDFSAAYNEAKKAQRAKIAYSLHVLEERGELGTGADAVADAAE